VLGVGGVGVVVGAKGPVMAAGGVLMTGASPGRVCPCIISETSPKPRTKAIKTPISGMVLLSDRLRARAPGTSTGSRSGIVIIRYPPMRPLELNGSQRTTVPTRRANNSNATRQVVGFFRENFLERQRLSSAQRAFAYAPSQTNGLNWSRTVQHRKRVADFARTHVVAGHRWSSIEARAKMSVLKAGEHHTNANHEGDRRESKSGAEGGHGEISYRVALDKRGAVTTVPTTRRKTPLEEMHEAGRLHRAAIEAIIASAFHLGGAFAAIFVGAWSGERIYRRAVGWIAGIIIFLLVSGAILFVGLQIPGVGWRIEKMMQHWRR
jgi:hypothetical protein